MRTTIIKSILGMVVPDSGFITFNGNNILHDWHYRDHIGYMPQIGRYPDNMTIGDIIEMMKDIRSDAISLDDDLIVDLLISQATLAINIARLGAGRPSQVNNGFSSSKKSLSE